LLEVAFYRDARRRVSSVVATGHAQAGAHGEDVVCAAASAILQAARLGLARHANVRVAGAAKPGNFRLAVPASARDDAAVEAILATAELGIAQIARQYPRHVRIARRSEKTG